MKNSMLLVLLLFMLSEEFLIAQYCDEIEFEAQSSVLREYQTCNLIAVGIVEKIEHFSVVSKITDLIKSVEPGDTIVLQRVFVRPSEIYKGVENLPILEIITPADPRLCGFPFIVGKEYIIYGIYQNRYVFGDTLVPIFIFTDKLYRTKMYDRREEQLIRWVKKKYD